MVIIDTCVLIELLRGNKTTIEKLYEYEQKDIFVTPVVVAELYRGARDKNEFGRCRNLIRKFSVLSINEDVIGIFDSIFENYSISHRPTIPDMLIAATSVSYNIPLFTLNMKDFRFIPGIQLIS